MRPACFMSIGYLHSEPCGHLFAELEALFVFGGLHGLLFFGRGAYGFPVHLFGESREAFYGNACPRIGAEASEQPVFDAACFYFLQQRVHGRIKLVGVGGASDNEAFVLEYVAQYVRGVGGGNVVHDNVALSGFSQPLRHGFGHLLGVAVHGAVHNDDALVQGFVAAEFVVHVHHAGYLLAPYGSVRAANGLYGQPAEFLQGFLHGHAVLAHDVGVVAHHFVPVFFGVHLLVGDAAVQRAEASEAVAGKEDVVGLVEGHHGFRPVHHGREVELQGVPAQRERVAIFHFQRVVANAVVAFDHVERFVVPHQGDMRKIAPQQPYGAGMVGFHVVDDEVIDGARARYASDFVNEQVAEAAVHRVDNGYFLVLNQVGVVGYAVRQRQHVFKFVFLPVVHADIENGVCYGSFFQHDSLCLIIIGLTRIV